MRPRLTIPRAPQIRWSVPPGTRILLGILAATTLALTLHPAGALGWLRIDQATLTGLRLPALWLNWLSPLPAAGFAILLLAALLAWLEQDRLRHLWRRGPILVVGLGALGLAAALSLNHLLSGRLFGLILAAFTVGFGAASAERSFGPRKLLEFTALLLTPLGVIDALLAWLWPGSALGLLGGRGAGTLGTDALFHGLMAVYCARLGRRPLGVLPLQGRQLIWLFVALGALDMLFVSFRRGLATLAAILIARALIFGTWRPSAWLHRYHLWRLDRRQRRLRVIDGGRTLHRALAREEHRP